MPVEKESLEFWLSVLPKNAQVAIGPVGDDTPENASLIASHKGRFCGASIVGSWTSEQLASFDDPDKAEKIKNMREIGES